MQVLLQVDDYNAARIKMTAEMADTSQLAKTLVIKAEDARILEDVASMRAAYSQLYSLNAELLGEYNKRASMVKVASWRGHSWPLRAHQAASEGFRPPSALVRRGPALQIPPRGRGLPATRRPRRHFHRV